MRERHKVKVTVGKNPAKDLRVFVDGTEVKHLVGVQFQADEKDIVDNHADNVIAYISFFADVDIVREGEQR